MLGAINNISVNHNLENPEIGVIEKDKGTILPKMIEINLDFSPIHEADLGWDTNKTFRSAMFPYGAIEASDKPDQSSQLSTKDTWLNPAEIDESSYGSPINQFPAAETGSFAVIPGTAEDGAESTPDTSEQDAANAAARYAGLFGNARFNRDLKQYSQQDTNAYQESALRGAYDAGAARRGSDGASDAAYTIRKKAGDWADDYGD